MSKEYNEIERKLIELGYTNITAIPGTFLKKGYDICTIIRLTDNTDGIYYDIIRAGISIKLIPYYRDDGSLSIGKSTVAFIHPSFEHLQTVYCTSENKIDHGLIELFDVLGNYTHRYSERNVPMSVMF